MLPMTLLGLLLLLTITMAPHAAAAAATTTTATDGSCSAVSEVRAGGPGGKSREKGWASSVACYAPVRDERAGGGRGRGDDAPAVRLARDGGNWQAEYYLT